MAKAVAAKNLSNRGKSVGAWQKRSPTTGQFYSKTAKSSAASALSQKPVTKKAHITERQAIDAVGSYIVKHSR